jgi:hypothetical protein
MHEGREKNGGQTSEICPLLIVFFSTLPNDASSALLGRFFHHLRVEFGNPR